MSVFPPNLPIPQCVLVVIFPFLSWWPNHPQRCTSLPVVFCHQFKPEMASMHKWSRFWLPFFCGESISLPFVFNLPRSLSFFRFLCLKNKTSASVVFTTYTQKHPSIEKGPPFVQPLLNFIWFLLLAVDGYSLISVVLFLVSFSVVNWDYIFGCFLSRGKLTVFTVLCEQYQPSLKRDPMYNEVSHSLTGFNSVN